MTRCEVCAGGKQLIIGTLRFQELLREGKTLKVLEETYRGILVKCWGCES